MQGDTVTGKSYLQDYPIIDCYLGESKLENIWLEIESRISDVCDLGIQNGLLVYGGIAVPTPSGTCSTSLFQFALQKAIVSQVEKILSANANGLNRLETRLNDLVYHLYQIDDSLRSVVENELKA